MSAPSPRRFARHVILPEVGKAGQARLEATAVAITGDDRAAAIARLYLKRAGVPVEDGGRPTARVEVVPGRPALAEAAAAIGGAWTALEAMKASLGVGRPARPAPPLALGSGDDA